MFGRMALGWDLSAVFLMVRLGFREKEPFSSHRCQGICGERDLPLWC